MSAINNVSGTSKSNRPVECDGLEWDGLTVISMCLRHSTPSIELDVDRKGRKTSNCSEEKTDLEFVVRRFRTMKWLDEY